MKNVVITVLAILVLAMGGYLVYDKIIDKDNKTVENKDEETKNDDIAALEEKEIADNLFDKISNIETCISHEFDFDGKTKLTYSEIPEYYASSLVANNLRNHNKIQENTSDYRVSVQDYEEAFKRVFGLNSAVKLPQSFVLPISENEHLSFTLSNNVYIGSKEYSDCGDGHGEYIFKSYKKEGDKFYLMVYFVYPNGDGTYSPYFSRDIEMKKYTKEELTLHEDELIQYKYTFILENENYILDSIELEN